MKQILVILSLSLFTISSFGQETIFELMERNDLSITEIEAKAKQYFEKEGTGQGSGYKHYQRWLYERKFHLDDNGYFIDPTAEYNEFLQASNNMNSNEQSPSGFGPEAVSGIWSELGPFTWTRTSGWNPGTGRLTAMAVHPSNENVIYVGSPGGGLWKTTNSGSTWIPLNDYNSSWMSIFSIAIDPLNQNVVYAGTGNSANQLIKSTNAGLTWTVTGAGPTGTIRKILIHPTNTNIVFACASNGIFRSINAGTSWTQVQSTTKEDIEFKPNNPTIMYASGSTEVVKSIDGGISWNVLGTSIGITNVGRTLISVTPANPEYLYVVQASGSLFGRMYKSTNSGASFVTTVVGVPTSGTNYFGYETDGTGTSGQATHDMGMCASPTNAEEVHIAGIICWKSLNGGTSFTATTAWSLPNSIGYNHADVHGLEFVNNNIYSISDGGIYKSIDLANNWVDLSAGLGIRQFYRIASSPTNGSVVTGGAQDNGSVAKQSAGNWVDWLGADGMEGLVSPTNHLNIWGTSQNGQLYRSSNGGNSRVTIASIMGGAWVTPIAIHPTNETIVFAGGTAVYKSTNSGTSFTNISGTTITNALVDLAVAPSNPNYIYASYSNILYISTNGGATWTSSTAAGTITDICVSPALPSKLWITTSSGTGRVFVSTNSGSTFTNISGLLPTLSARSVVVDNSSDEKLYVGMSIGVYNYSNSNPNWTIMTDNLPLVAINELDIQYSTNKLRVATYGRGVWETSLNSNGCNAPSNLTASAITLTSATLAWSAVTGAVSYTLEYKASTSSTWIVLASAMTTSTYTLTGLASGIAYDYRVKTNCATAASYYVQAQFTTLTPPPTCISNYEPNETSTAAVLIPTNQSISAGINTSTDIDYFKVTTTVTSDFVATLSNLPLDYDLRMYNVSGTLLLSGSNSGTTNEVLTLNNLAAGTYVFQVFGYSGAFSLTQCYNLYVATTASPLCLAPSNLSTTAIAGTSCILNWNAASGAINYNIEYRVLGATTWTALTASTNTLSLSALNYLTTYEWRVSANCGMASSSVSTPISFTTLPNCPLNMPGSSFSSPIIVGLAPCISSPYIDTKTNSIGNCFLNNYGGPNNQSSPNIWYQFTLAAPATVEISHCGSPIGDSYVHLLDQSGNHLFSNDDNGPICAGVNASLSVALGAGTYYVVSEGYGTATGQISTSIRRTDACSSELNLTIFLQGYYVGAGLMAPVLLNQGYIGLPLPTSSQVDEVVVELHHATTPYALVATTSSRLQTNGTMTCTFAPLNGNYFIVVKHRNSLETWSSSPISITPGINTYNFSSSQAQAYGGNLIQVSPNIWAMYSGELNADGNIDLADWAVLQYGIENFFGGYEPTDLNGDGNVDLQDTPNIELNITSFIYSIQP